MFKKKIGKKVKSKLFYHLYKLLVIKQLQREDSKDA